MSGLINTGGRSAGTARGRNRVFGALVIAEIALAVVLVIGAGLLVRSYSQLSSADPGFDPRRMVTLVLNVTGRFDVQNMRFDQERQAVVYDGTGMLGVAQFYQELIRRIEALPGVASAGAVFAAPLNHGLFPIVLWPYPVVGSSAARGRSARVRLPGFARVLHDARHPARSPAACSSRPIGAARPASPSSTKSYARAYLDGQDPVGRRIALLGGNWRPGSPGFGQVGEQTVAEAEIVGVIPDIKQANLQAARAAGGLSTARATDHAQDGDRRPLGDRRSRRADSGDSPRARGAGPHDSPRVRRLLGRRRRVVGAAPARSARARSCSASCR